MPICGLFTYSDVSGTYKNDKIALFTQRPAVMLMAPDDQVEEIRDERLWDETGGTALGSILMKHQDVEPLPAKNLLKTTQKVSPSLLSQRQLKLNLILPE